MASLLCTANFRSSVGFAWKFFHQIHTELARAAAGNGMSTWVAFPEIDGPAPGLSEPARMTRLDARLGDLKSVLATLRFIRRERVRVLYMFDQRCWHLAYCLFRLAGVQRIVVYCQTSYSSWHVPRWRRALKALMRLIPGSTPDTIVCVSEHVAAKQRHYGHKRVVRLWNSLPPMPPGDPEPIRDLIDAPGDRPVVACCARAHNDKGVQHLLRAFDRMDSDAELVFIGDGPHLGEWEQIRDNLTCRDRIHFVGYRGDAMSLVGGADIAVVPSVYEEAFGLAALEPMAQGVPVIATEQGGLPEIVADGETGIVVPAGDEVALSNAMDRLLSDPDLRRRMGEAGVRRARRLFDRDEAMARLVDIVLGPKGTIRDEGEAHHRASAIRYPPAAPIAM